MASTIRDLVIDVNTPDADVIFKALGHPLRLKILRLLATHAHTVSQIAENLGTPISTLNQHLKVLEDAGVIETDLRPASRGTEKVCSGVYKKLICGFEPPAAPLEQAIEISMPIGAYSDFQITRPCGLASKTNIIGQLGNPDSFLEPDHIEAQALWFGIGYVEYRFPKRLPHGAVPIKLSLTMELCSETQRTNDDYPSDISVWINSKDLGSWLSPGDFGSRRGLLNPDWWKFCQFGILKTWQVDEKGSYIDGLHSANVTIHDLSIPENPFILVRIGVKPDAEHPGGVNILGASIGDYPIDIILRITYTKS